MKSRVIFASLVLGLGLMINEANAATTINIDDSPAAIKPASALLVNGSEKQLASFIGQYGSKFVRNTNWQNFMSVISLYNQNPSTVLSISPADRDKFNKAAAQVIDQLAKQNKAEATHWMNQVDYTTRMINFLWNATQFNTESTDIQ